jgi:hypothetical protein
MPLSSTSNEKLAEARAAMVHKNRGVTIPEVAQKLNVSQGPLFSIVYNKFCVCIVCAQAIGRSVKVLLYGHLFIYLKHYHSKGHNFFNCIIMRDETWIHHY